MSLRSLRALLPSFALLVACGDPGGADGGDLLEVRIDGERWVSEPATVVATPASPGVPGALGFQGSRSGDPARTLTLTLTRIQGPGTYPLGVNPNGGTGGLAVLVEAPASFSTPLDARSGTVTLEAIEGGRVRGRFAATLVSVAGQGTRALTEGRFDLPLTAGFVPASPAQRGSTVAASLGGAAWEAGTVVASGAGTTTLGFSATDPAWTVTLIAGPVEGPGVFELGAGGPQRIVAQDLAAGRVFGGSAGDTGSITFTEVSEARIVGTFSGRLVRSPPDPAVPPLVVEGGRFDLLLRP